MFRIRLKMLRENKRMTQQEFANTFGISKGTIGMWESGAREPRSIADLQRLADFFDVTVDYLLCRTDDPRPAAEKIEPTPAAEGGPNPELWEIIQRIPESRMPEVERYLRFQAESKEKP